jgi:PTH1 family peptidyl-tRNA hydrolase
MSWLQKRPQVSNPQLLYTSGMNKTTLLVGLGNVGEKYDLTRHNVGFYCIDYFVKNNDEMSDWTLKKELKCRFSSGRMGENRVIAIEPTTYMNLSGQSVQAVLNFYKVALENVIVIHDELDLDFGSIRMRQGGSSAGHNGIKNITELTGEEYSRIRIGVGPKKPASIKSEDFVLKRFSKEEQGKLVNLSKEVNSILSEYIFGTKPLNETRSFLV